MTQSFVFNKKEQKCRKLFFLKLLALWGKTRIHEGENDKETPVSEFPHEEQTDESVGSSRHLQVKNKGGGVNRPARSLLERQVD